MNRKKRASGFRSSEPEADTPSISHELSGALPPEHSDALENNPKEPQSDAADESLMDPDLPLTPSGSPLQHPPDANEIPASDVSEQAIEAMPDQDAEVEPQEDPPEDADGGSQKNPPEASRRQKPKKAKRKRGGFWLVLRDFISLLVKFVLILLIVVVAFTFLFGGYRNTDPGMIPAIKDGDLVFYYRLDKFYSSGDIFATSYKGNTICLRVAAVAGDVVDINENGLYINGSLQFEHDIYERTYRFEEGVDFPLTVPEGAVFALGDARENAADSRIFGPIRIDDTFGKVMAIFRRRSL